jgi:hypothetical protein
MDKFADIILLVGTNYHPILEKVQVNDECEIPAAAVSTASERRLPVRFHEGQLLAD